MAEKIHRLSLIRPIYRALLNSGRTYAAFERKTVFPIVEKLADRKEILDPMAGYGLLMAYCSELNVSSFCIEYNPSLYLWEILTHPGYAKQILLLTENLEKLKRKWPRTSVRATVSEDWFPDESKRILYQLFLLSCQVANKIGLKGRNAKEIPLGFLLPFVGRLSASTATNMSTHVKIGGMCVYTEWRDDFSAYISVLRKRLTENLTIYRKRRHTITMGDCRIIKLPKKRFSAMLTSPPYPNSRDYTIMFAPENAFLGWLEKEGKISGYTLAQRLIGSVCVSEVDGMYKRQPKEVKSQSARKFLYALENFKGSQRAIYDNKVYYVPYFSNYFAELEKAYENIASALTKDFEGYIIAVDNTARDQNVPVAKSIVEIWRSLGFKSKFFKTREVFHAGGINPRARGFKAKHTEYIIRIWRD